MSNLLHRIEEILEYSFNDKTLPLKALTHPSRINESHASNHDYQRLEFLGDAVLGLLLAEILFNSFPEADEGTLSQLRARLANKEMLADRARYLDIGELVILGRGEEQTSGRCKDSILADVLEALIASIYLDGGLSAARKLVENVFKESVADPESLAFGRDFKTELQELLCSKGRGGAIYTLSEESGPPHDRHFLFSITLDDASVFSGEGRSKKGAQQAAAASAVAALRNSSGDIC